jgi:hypothetical protein
MLKSSDPRRALRRTALALVVMAALAGCGAPDEAPAKRVRAAAGGTFTSLAPDVYRPCGIAAEPEVVWVLACSGTVVGIRSSGARARHAVEGEIVGLDALAGDGSGSLWVTTATGSGSDRRGAVVPLDPSSGAARPAVDLGSSIPMHATPVEGSLWVAAHDGRVVEVKGTSARGAASGGALLWILAEGTTMWTVAEDGDVAERAADGTPKRTYAGVLANTHAAAAGLGSVWLASEGRLVRLGGGTGEVESVDVSGTVNHIEACNGSVWLSQPDFGLRSLDASGKVLKSVRLEAAPSYLACSGSTLWILSEDGGLASIDVMK